MQYQKRNLLTIALASALAIAFASGCDDDKKSGTNGTSGTGGTAAKTYNVMTWSKLDKTSFDNKEDATMLAVSGNKDWIYVVAGANKELRALSAGAAGADFAANVKVPANWKKIPLAHAAGGPGKALLTAHNNNVVTEIHPTLKGAFVTINGDGVAEKGAWYAEGNAFKAGWASKVADIPNATITTNATVRGFVATKGNDEVPIIVGKSATPSNGALGAVTLATPAAFTNTLTRGVTAFAFDRPSFPAQGTTNFYIVDAAGVTPIAPADLAGADKAVTAPAGGQVGNAANWGAAAEFGADNDAPIAAYFSKKSKKLYIGFDVAGNNKGGVASYDETGNTTTPPDADWKGTKVIDFAEDDAGKVWAVTPTGLIGTKIDGNKVKKDGELNAIKVAGNKADAKAGKDGYVNDMPASNITAADYVGKNLIVTTDNAGVHVMTTTTATVQ